MITNKPGDCKISGRALLRTTSIALVLLWGGLLLFTRFVSPQSTPARWLFFLLISLALLSTLIPVIYLFRVRFPRRRLASAAACHTLREAILLTTCIVFNLLLRLLQSWSIFTTLISLGIVVVIEILALNSD